MTTSSSDMLLAAKIIVVGNTSCGKTCMLERFVENVFRTDVGPTIGVHLRSKGVDTSTNKLKLNVWDTAGQEEFQSIARSYYRESAGALLVYDTTDERSFLGLPAWLVNVREFSKNPELTIALVGNKIDLTQERVVERQRAEDFARHNNLIFCETSAKTGDGVEVVFKLMAKAISRKIDQGVLLVDDPSSGVKRAVVAPPPPSSSNGSRSNNVDVTGRLKPLSDRGGGGFCSGCMGGEAQT